jgi:hypothetical protein
MSLLMPNGMNESLRHPPPRESTWDALAKMAAQAEACEPSPERRAAAVGNLILSGRLKVASGLNGKEALSKRACDGRRFGLQTDHPVGAGVRRAVAAKLATTPGFTPWGQPASLGFGRAVRKLKNVNDSHLGPLPNPAAPPPAAPISDRARAVLDQLTSGLRQRVVSAFMAPPEMMEPDAYRWNMWITELRDAIDAECEAMGIDGAALIRSLPPAPHFDPMVQDHPFVPPEGAPGRVVPPASPREPGPFASNKVAKRGAPLRKRASEILSQALSSLPTYLRHLVLSFADVRKRVTAAEWREVMKRDSLYASLQTLIGGQNQLTRDEKATLLELIA